MGSVWDVDQLLAMAWRIRSGHEGPIRASVVDFLDGIIEWVNVARKELQRPVVEVSPEPINVAVVENHGIVTAIPVDPKAARKAYLKEYMAKRRAAAKAGKDVVPPEKGE